MRYRIVLLCLFIVFLAHPATAQKTLTVDLAKGRDPITQPVSPGMYHIVIKNRLPGDTFSYTVVVEIKAEPIQALTWPGKQVAIASLVQRVAETDPECIQLQNDLIDAYNALIRVDDESNVAENVKELEETMQFIENQSDCMFPNPPSKDDAQALIQQTSRLLSSYELAQGERLEVTVTRQQENPDDDPLTWKYVFTTGPHGRWLTSFGFAAIATVLNEEQVFFTKANGEEGFVITEEENRKQIEQNQLHEKLYRVNPYVALTFRFNNNIFTTNSEE